MQNDRHEEPANKGQAPAAGSETILLVEDEASVRRLAREFLEISGYTVLEASNGADAIQLAEQHDSPIHLMVTDVVMPGMSGWELAQTMRARRADMKVIYMSGYTDKVVSQDGGFDPGMVFLQKPFPLSTLVEKVRELLGAEVQQQL